MATFIMVLVVMTIGIICMVRQENIQDLGQDVRLLTYEVTKLLQNTPPLEPEADMVMVEPANDINQALPEGWVLELANVPDEIKAHAMVEIYVMMRDRNMDVIQDAVERASNPESPDFGRYLTLREIEEVTADTNAIEMLRRRWVEPNGATIVSSAGNIVRVGTNCLNMEKMLRNSYVMIRNVQTGQRRLACYGATFVPTFVYDAIIGLTGTRVLGYMTRGFILQDDPQFTNQSVVPSLATDPTFIYQAYGIPLSNPPACMDGSTQYANNTQSFSQFVAVGGTQVFKFQDVQSFATQFVPPVGHIHVPGLDTYTFTSPRAHGCPQGTQSCNDAATASCTPTSSRTCESSLDSQYLKSISWNTDRTMVFTDFDDPAAWALAMFTNPALVNSVSYQFSTVLLEQRQSILVIINNKMMQLAAAGINVIFSSGDNGVSCDRTRCTSVQQTVDCERFSPPATSNTYCPRHAPVLPASLNWVTSVGATRFVEAPGGFVEQPMNFVSRDGITIITSGGGFGLASVSPLPDWQRAHVEHYLQDLDQKLADGRLPPKYLWNGNTANRNGQVLMTRGYPDISLAGSNFKVVGTNGQLVPVSGTSASAPVFASMVSSWNAMRMCRGKKPLGFLPPLLYRLATDHPEAFHDIVSGSNPDGTINNLAIQKLDSTTHTLYTQNCCTNKGFTAAPGWDPVTGLGTPRFDVLTNLLVEVTP